MNSHLTLYWREDGLQIPDSLLEGSEGTLEEARRREMRKEGEVPAAGWTAGLPMVSAKSRPVLLATAGLSEPLGLGGNEYRGSEDATPRASLRLVVEPWLACAERAQQGM